MRSCAVRLTGRSSRQAAVTGILGELLLLRWLHPATSMAALSDSAETRKVAYLLAPGIFLAAVP
jgi:hypothetical protein